MTNIRPRVCDTTSHKHNSSISSHHITLQFAPNNTFPVEALDRWYKCSQCSFYQPPATDALHTLVFFRTFIFNFFFQINTKLQRSFYPQEVLYLLLVFEKINNYSCRKQNKIQNSAFIVFVVIKSKFELGSLFTDTSVADACGN